MKITKSFIKQQQRIAHQWHILHIIAEAKGNATIFSIYLKLSRPPYTNAPINDYAVQGMMIPLIRRKLIEKTGAFCGSYAAYRLTGVDLK